MQELPARGRGFHTSVGAQDTSRKDYDDPHRIRVPLLSVLRTSIPTSFREASISCQPILVIRGYRRSRRHTHPRIQHASARVREHRLDVHDEPHPRHLSRHHRHSRLPTEVLYRHQHKCLVPGDWLDAVHLEPIVYFRRNNVLGWQHFDPIGFTPDPEAWDAPQQT